MQVYSGRDNNQGGGVNNLPTASAHPPPRSLNARPKNPTPPPLLPTGFAFSMIFIDFDGFLLIFIDFYIFRIFLCIFVGFGVSQQGVCVLRCLRRPEHPEKTCP